MLDCHNRKLQTIASRLGVLKSEKEFVVGTVTELNIDNPEATDIRPTIYVDSVALSSKNSHASIDDALRERRLHKTNLMTRQI